MVSQDIHVRVGKISAQSYKCAFWYKRTVETFFKNALSFSHLSPVWFFFLMQLTEIAETIYSALFFLLCFPLTFDSTICIINFSFTVVIPLFMGSSGKLEKKKEKITSKAAHTGCWTATQIAI